MTIEQMIREVLEAVKQDKSLYEAYCKGTDPQTFSSGDLLVPANRLNACLRENDKPKPQHLRRRGTMNHIWVERFGLPCCIKCGIVRRRDDKNSPCKGPARVGPRGEQPLGGNDENGVVYCYLCDWRKDCGANMERIEHELRQHIEQAHGLKVLFRVDNETGQERTIPL